MAIVATALGVGYDAGTGSDSLGAVFTVCYVTGCLLAVLAVRQSGVFSTVIQPPLILFVAVPSAYYFFHRSEIQGVKDVLINCGYPLIERFPLMFFTSAAVLVVGMVRWYLANSAHHGAATATVEEAADDTPATEKSDAKAPSRRGRRRATTRAAVDDETATPVRKTRTAAAGPSRARHTRPPETDIVDPAARRSRRGQRPMDPQAEPRRRPRGDDPRDRRNLPPAERRDPRERQERSGRPDRADRYDRPQHREWQDRQDRPERRRRMPEYSEYDAYDPRESFDRGPVNGASGGNPTHHPVSRVRYRASDDGESRVEHRTRPRRPRHAGADAWDHDD